MVTKTCQNRSFYETFRYWFVYLAAPEQNLEQLRMSDAERRAHDLRRSRSRHQRRLGGKAPRDRSGASPICFSLSAGSFNAEQIELFDDVLERLVKTIELRAIADVSARIALAEMSQQLAPVPQAPPSVVRRLARHDEISVAGPVLTESARLSPEDLVEIANTKGEQHLLAISGRWWLKEVVTDALLARRYPERLPPHRQQSRRAVFRGRICDRHSAGRIRSRTRRSAPASGSTCRRHFASNCCAVPPRRCGRGC